MVRCSPPLFYRFTPFCIPILIHVGDNVVDGRTVGFDVVYGGLLGGLIEQFGDGCLGSVEGEVMAIAFAFDELNA